jgi:flagellar biosynthesis component FlhA
MWLLDWLPEWFFYALGLFGLLGVFVTYIPFIPKIYKIPIQVFSVLLISASVYMAGAISKEEEWQLRVKEMEAKVAEAEAKSEKVNTKIVTKLIKRTEVVRVRGQEIVKYIDKEVAKYDPKFAAGGECELPKEFIKSINDAAEQIK